MNSRTKGIAALIALLPVAIAGLYLSGFLVLTLLGEHAQVHLLTYWRYWQVVDQPVWHPYATKIKLSGICGFGLPVMLYLIPVHVHARRVHGLGPGGDRPGGRGLGRWLWHPHRDRDPVDCAVGIGLWRRHSARLDHQSRRADRVYSREQRDAEEYSKMLGETTVRRRQRTQSYG
nr:hypothetical protein [Xanthomonas albilineans]